MGTLLLVDADLTGLVTCACHSRPGHEDPVCLLPRGPASAGQQQTFAMIADLYDLRLLDNPAPGTESMSQRLLAAATLAQREGHDRLVWSIGPGWSEGAAPDLELISQESTRAMLVEHLACLDGRVLTIETPLLDLSDEQIADLAMDVNVPLQLCWWFSDPGPEACALRQRWGRPLTQAGWALPDATAVLPGTR